MGVASWLGFKEAQPVAEVAAVATDIGAVVNENEILKESMADLELALEDRGWRLLSMQSEREFSRAGLRQATGLARIMSVANPLCKRGLSLRTGYIWGQGVQIHARQEDHAEQDVNAVLQRCMDNPLNMRTIFSDKAQEVWERECGTAGNRFFALVTKPLSGFVQIRTIPGDQVDDIHANPEDAADVWFYERRWDVKNGAAWEQRVLLYPDINYRPSSKPVSFNGMSIRWDSPVVHEKVNDLDGWKFGIGDLYPALPYARAYTDFLGDWVTLTKALSRFAWRATSKGSKAQNARTALATAPTTNDVTGQPNRVGATVLTSPDQTLEAIPKTGATIDSESGKPVAAMVAAALDVSVIDLLADPGQTGARAVAETLDKPIRYAMQQRRSVHTATMLQILNHVIDQAIKAPRGPLRGKVTRDLDTGRETITLANEQDRTIDVVWPPLDEVPIETLIKAIVEADASGKMPALTTARLMLQAFGVDNIDELLDELTDDQGNFVDKSTSSAGQAAVDAFNGGEDPAAVIDPQADAPAE